VKGAARATVRATVTQSGRGTPDAAHASERLPRFVSPTTPVDDCTFWYTTEYLKASGTFNWSTWNTSFKMPGCV
jgi:hypothetical protein